MVVHVACLDTKIPLYQQYSTSFVLYNGGGSGQYPQVSTIMLAAVSSGGSWTTLLARHGAAGGCLEEW